MTNIPNPTDSHNGEQQLRTLEDEQARINIRGGVFPKERRMLMIRAHNIQKTGVFPDNYAESNPVYVAAHQRYLEGNRNPEVRLQQLRDYYTKQGQQLFGAALGGNQQSIRQLQQEKESPIELYNQLRKQAEQGRLNHQAAVSEVNSEANRVKKPSFFIYSLLYYAATVADILSFFEKPIEATGIGEVPVFIINLIISVFFFLAGIWLNRKLKNIRLSGKQIARISEQTAQRVAQYRQWTASVLKAFRGSKIGRRFLQSKTGRNIVKATAKLARVTRYPLFRSAAALVAELIPILDLVPWYTLNIYWTHRDHRREYETTQTNVAEAGESLMSEQQELGSLNNSLKDLKDYIENEEKAA